MIPSAIPTIGRPIDIRDVRNITAVEGQVVAIASHVYQQATKFFAGDGSRRDLPLNQRVRAQSIPVLATYGVTERLNLGVGINAYSEIERKLSVLNFTPGASILGQNLPVGAVTTLEQSGEGAGDVTLLAQFRPDWFDGRVQSLVSLDVVAPTARSNPRNPLDLPLGQGFWTDRLSYSAVKDIFPMTYFARVGYEWNHEDTLADAAGNRFTLDTGDGVFYTAGAAYAIGEEFSLQGLFVGAWRDETVRSDQPVPTPFLRSLDFRPGYTFRKGDFLLTQQLSIPLSGANVLSAEGVLTTVEYRF